MPLEPATEAQLDEWPRILRTFEHFLLEAKQMTPESATRYLYLMRQCAETDGLTAESCVTAEYETLVVNRVKKGGSSKSTLSCSVSALKSFRGFWTESSRVEKRRWISLPSGGKKREDFTKDDVKYTLRKSHLSDSASSRSVGLQPDKKRAKTAKADQSELSAKSVKAEPSAKALKAEPSVKAAKAAKVESSLKAVKAVKAELSVKAGKTQEAAPVRASAESAESEKLPERDDSSAVPSELSTIRTSPPTDLPAADEPSSKRIKLEPAEDTSATVEAQPPAVSSKDPITIDLTGYWESVDEQGAKWTYLLSQAPRAPQASDSMQIFGKIIGSIKLYICGTVASDSKVRWEIIWPAGHAQRDAVTYEGTISKGAGIIDVTGVAFRGHQRLRERCHSFKLTRVQEARLSVPRAHVLRACCSYREEMPKALLDSTASAQNPVRNLGFQFALVPPSPHILVDEVVSGSWAHGIGLTPGDEILTINGQNARDIWPVGRFMEYCKCRPVSFTFRKSVASLDPGWPPLGMYSIPDSKETKVTAKADSDATSSTTASTTASSRGCESVASSRDSKASNAEEQEEFAQREDATRDRELEATFAESERKQDQKPLELWMFEGTWQITFKGSKFGEVKMGADGRGELTETAGTKKTKHMLIKGKGTPTDPYIVNESWLLLEWRRTKRIWRSTSSDQQVIWTLMSRPTNGQIDIYQKKWFWKEIEKDPPEDREKAAQIRHDALKLDSGEKSGIPKQGLPLHLFTRQESVAWTWEGINKPLRKDLVDADDWHDEIK